MMHPKLVDRLQDLLIPSIAAPQVPLVSEMKRLLILCTFAFGFRSPAQQGTASIVHTDSTPVKVQHVEEFRTSSGGNFLQVAYDYDFVGKKSIYIRGLGNVPGRGSFDYFTPESSLEFRESIEGPVLLTIPLLPTEVAMGAEHLDFPRPRDFGDFLTGTWKKSEALFKPHMVSVIDKYFIEGKLAMQVDSIDYVITSYRTLPTTDPNLLAYVVVSISRPYDTSRLGFDFHLSYLAREKRKLSDTPSDKLSKKSKDAVDLFIGTLMTELKDEK
jgi:hypothetical protein